MEPDGPSQRITIGIPWELFKWLKTKGEGQMTPYIVGLIEKAREEAATKQRGLRTLTGEETEK